MSVTEQDFDLVRKLVCDQAGIVLESGKQYLVDARLGTLAKKLGLDTIEQITERLRRKDLVTQRQVVEALTTNETTFFRDIEPFEALRKHIIPQLIADRSSTRTLRIWYGASSTGQEPYSVAMLLQEHFPQLATWNVAHLATDLNLEVLERAKAGRFSQLEVNRGLPINYLVKYFEKAGTDWQLKPEIRTKIKFEPMNLVKEWPTQAPFDIVMLRNVMIYFDLEDKRKILGKIRRRLAPDGYLLLGSAETTLNLDESFQRVQYDKTGCFRLISASATAAVRGAA